MYHHYRTQGILLTRENRGEADQLFFIFTKDFGRVEVIARAIRKVTSKLRSNTGIFYLAEIEFIQGKHYKILTDATALEKFTDFRQNMTKLTIAGRMAEATDLLIIRPQKDEKVWELLSAAFSFLNNWKTEDWKLEVIYFYFLWNLLSLLGYSPELYDCPVCRKPMKPEIFYFIPKDGGLVCGHCASRLEVERGEKEFIKVNTVKLIRIFLKKPIDILYRLKLDKLDLENFRKVSELYGRSFQEKENKV
ncbi:MAG: DNA repair protein RecO [Candidatus Pacebacteria bacterium]|nr:DNA repair protein RecO [Candidatus Paceibacterota bacterium]